MTLVDWELLGIYCMAGVVFGVGLLLALLGLLSILHAMFGDLWPRKGPPRV